MRLDHGLSRACFNLSLGAGVYGWNESWAPQLPGPEDYMDLNSMSNNGLLGCI